MAEEAIDIPVTPEKVEPNGDHKRGDSTGNLHISMDREKVQPRYLSASMASCHDFCKFGVKHVPEKKARTPIPKGITSRPGESQDHVADVNQEERKITSKPLTDSKSQTFDIHQVIEDPASAKKVAVSTKHLSVTLSDSMSQTIDKQQVIEAPASAKKVAVSSKHLSVTLSDSKSQTIDKQQVMDAPASAKKVAVLSKHRSLTLSDSKSQTIDKHQVIKPLASAKKVSVSSKHLSLALSDSKSQTIDKHQVIEAPASAKKVAVLSKHLSLTLSDSKSQIIDKLKVIKKEIPASAKKVAVSSKRFSWPGDKMDGCAKHTSDSRSKPKQAKPSPISTQGHLNSRRYSDIILSREVGVLHESPVGGSSCRRNTKINASKEMETPKFRKIKDSVPITVFLSPRTSIERELSAKSGNYKEPKKVSSLKSQKTVRKAEPKHPIAEAVPEKTLYAIETKPDNSTQNGSDTTQSSQSLSPSSGDKKLECGRNGLQNSRSPPSSENKELKRTRKVNQNARSSSSLSLSSHKKNLKHYQKGNCDASSSSSLSAMSSSSYASESMRSAESDPILEGIGTKVENQIPNHKVGRPRRPKRVGILSLKDKVVSPQKLNFKRGKVIDVQPNNATPRRLKFKQRRVLGENPNGKADTKRGSLEKLVAIDELNGSKTEPKKVVLRRQNVEGKKDGQSLLNNVIEETASKLVHTRKSKVKALVSAFETVISLHDTKSSAKTSGF